MDKLELGGKKKIALEVEEEVGAKIALKTQIKIFVKILMETNSSFAKILIVKKK